MLTREYKNLDMAAWHNLFVLYCTLLGNAKGSEHDKLVANICALEKALYIMGDARRNRIGNTEAVCAIEDIWSRGFLKSMTLETMDMLDNMLADLDQWARDDRAEASAKFNEVFEKPQKKSFFKRIFSK